MIVVALSRFLGFIGQLAQLRHVDQIQRQDLIDRQLLAVFVRCVDQELSSFAAVRPLFDVVLLNLLKTALYILVDTLHHIIKGVCFTGGVGVPVLCIKTTILLDSLFNRSERKVNDSEYFVLCQKQVLFEFFEELTL